ncbi:MAG: HU family DNA-binding protein [Bdellovibrionales bacterium]|nr:HU family DNA-binding protein [Bdellovibrionales bacterium]
MAAKKKIAASATTIKSARVGKPANGTQFSQTELFDCIKDCCELDNRRTAKDVYTAFSEMIQDALKKGYKVPLPGIGKMQVRRSKARMGRNPATGETIRIAAKKRVRLTPSKACKEAVL